MLLHPPPLASEFRASYGEMSRRSGFAAKADNHSDTSPSLESIVCERSSTCLPHTLGELKQVPRSRFDSAVYASTTMRVGELCQTTQSLAIGYGARVADATIHVRLCSVPERSCRSASCQRRVLQTSRRSDGPSSVKTGRAAADPGRGPMMMCHLQKREGGRHAGAGVRRIPWTT